MLPVPYINPAVVMNPIEDPFANIQDEGIFEFLNEAALAEQEIVVNPAVVAQPKSPIVSDRES